MKRTIIFLLVSIFMISIAMESQATRKRPGRKSFGNITLKAQSSFQDVIPAINNYNTWLEMDARTGGRNPQTGKEIKIAAKTLQTEFDEAIAAAEELMKAASAYKDRGVHTLLKQYSIELTNVEYDFAKLMRGNQAAGTRVRKGMQDLKNIAQEIRKEVQDSKNAG